MQGAMLGSNASGIGGRDGYAWIADGLGSNTPEELLSSLTPRPEQLRPLLAGWLFLNLDALRGERRAAFETAFAAADREAVRSPLVPMPASAFAPPRSAYDAFAYDAVWATALGIAAWAQNRSKDVVSGIRGARFVGASGPVAFDNATGDRAVAGLTIQLINIRPADPNVTDWSAVRLVKSAVGVWEQSQGPFLLCFFRFLMRDPNVHDSPGPETPETARCCLPPRTRREFRRPLVLGSDASVGCRLRCERERPAGLAGRTAGLGRSVGWADGAIRRFRVSASRSLLYAAGHGQSPRSVCSDARMRTLLQGLMLCFVVPGAFSYR